MCLPRFGREHAFKIKVFQFNQTSLKIETFMKKKKHSLNSHKALNTWFHFSFVNLVEYFFYLEISRYYLRY